MNNEIIGFTETQIIPLGFAFKTLNLFNTNLNNNKSEFYG